MARDFESERNRVLSDAVDYAFKNCGAKEGEILNEEHIKKINHLVMEKLTPFLMRHMSRRN